jgi:hypothetical protein
MFRIRSDLFCFGITFEEHFTRTTYDDTNIGKKSRSSAYFALQWRFLGLCLDRRRWRCLIQISIRYAFHYHTFSLMKMHSDKWTWEELTWCCVTVATSIYNVEENVGMKEETHAFVFLSRKTMEKECVCVCWVDAQCSSVKGTVVYSGQKGKNEKCTNWPFFVDWCKNEKQWFFQIIRKNIIR